MDSSAAADCKTMDKGLDSSSKRNELITKFVIRGFEYAAHLTCPLRWSHQIHNS
jgi:hypothetical protein